MCMAVTAWWGRAQKPPRTAVPPVATSRSHLQILLSAAHGPRPPTPVPGETQQRVAWGRLRAPVETASPPLPQRPRCGKGSCGYGLCLGDEGGAGLKEGRGASLGMGSKRRTRGLRIACGWCYGQQSRLAARRDGRPMGKTSHARECPSEPCSLDYED